MFTSTKRENHGGSRVSRAEEESCNRRNAIQDTLSIPTSRRIRRSRTGLEPPNRKRNGGRVPRVFLPRPKRRHTAISRIPAGRLNGPTRTMSAEPRPHATVSESNEAEGPPKAPVADAMVASGKEAEPEERKRRNRTSAVSREAGGGRDRCPKRRQGEKRRCRRHAFRAGPGLRQESSGRREPWQTEKSTPDRSGTCEPNKTARKTYCKTVRNPVEAS